MEVVVTIESSATSEAAAAQRRFAPGGREGSLVRAVARAPLGLRSKLLLGFGTIAVSLVVVGVLGIIALRDSNARVKLLGDLRLRAAAAQAVQSAVAGYGAVLVERANMTPNAGTPVGRGVKIAPSSFYVIDATINQSLSSVLDAATALETTEPTFFARFYRLYSRLAVLSQTALAQDNAGKGNGIGPVVRREVALARSLQPIADALAKRTQRQAEAVVAQSNRSFAMSRDVFIAVAAGSVVLYRALIFTVLSALGIAGGVGLAGRRLQ